MIYYSILQAIGSVLGPPGSGCSTFLRTIANDHSSFLGVTGSLDYSGFTPSEILKKYRGEVSYVRRYAEALFLNQGITNIVMYY